MTSAFDILTPVRKGSDFSGLCRQIRECRLLERRPGHYVVRTGLTLLALAATWTAFVIIGGSWLQTVTAVVLAIVSTQVAFLGHDGGHQQVCRTRRGNDVFGMVAGDLLVGLSFGWWVDKHNRHHANPNHVDKDPDIGDGVLAFTTEQIASRTGAFGRFLGGHQAWLFFPLLSLEGLNLHVASVRSLLGGRTHRYRRTEMALFVVHIAAYLGGVLYVLGPVQGLVFIAIHQAVFGVYLGCSFAPNHKGMPIVADGRDIDFLRRQVLTSRNVRGGWFTDLLLGGLNYQVEHHLFPSMPRPSLRKAQRIVQAYCAEYGIHYTETSLAGSYAATLRHLHTLGAPLRARPRVALDSV